MEESILISIRKLLGIGENDASFDTDIITHINTTFTILTDIGVGPSEGFEIEDDMATWKDFITEPKKFNKVKTYMYIKVKLVFDPPSNSNHLKALEAEADRLEWRLNVAAETKSQEVQHE